MKTKVLLTAIIALLSIVTVDAQNNMFAKLSNNKNITTVSISKALLSMMPDTGIDMNGANIKNLTDKLEKLEIYTSDNKEAMNMMNAEVDVLSKNKAYQTLMTIKEVDNFVTFYAQQDKDKFKSLVMVVNQPSQSVIIRLEGNFSPEDIQGVMNSTGKKKK